MNNSLKSFFSSLKERGIKKTCALSFAIGYDYFYDIKNGVDTVSWVDLDDMKIDSSKKQHAAMYQAALTISLRKIIRKLRIAQDNVIVDLGCGKGKVLLVASEFGYREIRGLELSPVLCDIAASNCAIYKDKTGTETNFVIINSDVRDYTIKEDEKVFFLFNPFDASVLEHVLGNIKESLERQSREIWIIYCHPVQRNAIDKNRDFHKVNEFISWGQEVIVYSNNRAKRD